MEVWMQILRTVPNFSIFFPNLGTHHNPKAVFVRKWEFFFTYLPQCSVDSLFTKDYVLKSESIKTAHITKLAITKSSTIFAQSLWNLVKINTSWGNDFDQVSWQLDKNCGILLMVNFWMCAAFFDSDFTMI